MSVQSNFHRIQAGLIDPSARGQERRGIVCALATVGKIVSAGWFIGSALFSLASAIAMLAHPILGGIGVAMGMAGMFLSHEAFIICKNVESASKHKNVIQNMSYVAMNALTPEQLAQSTFKGTLCSRVFHLFAN